MVGIRHKKVQQVNFFIVKSEAKLSVHNVPRFSVPLVLQKTNLSFLSKKLEDPSFEAQ